MEVGIQPLQSTRLSSRVGERTTRMPRVTRIEGSLGVAALERSEQERNEVLSSLAVELAAVRRAERGRARFRRSGLGERLEDARHLERRSSPGSDGFDLLAEGGEDVGDLLDREGEVSRVGCDAHTSAGVLEGRRGGRTKRDGVEERNSHSEFKQKVLHSEILLRLLMIKLPSNLTSVSVPCQDDSTHFLVHINSLDFISTVLQRLDDICRNLLDLPSLPHQHNVPLRPGGRRLTFPNRMSRSEFLCLNLSLKSYTPSVKNLFHPPHISSPSRSPSLMLSPRSKSTLSLEIVSSHATRCMTSERDSPVLQNLHKLVLASGPSLT